MKDQELALAFTWQKSSASGSGNCVEVAQSGRVFVRDSKNPQGDFLGFRAAYWMEFIDGVRGEGLTVVSRSQPR
ncbi:DUF397 domain-containing protein [Streptomyces sp. NPDC058256]|uniref:DUF397 domain-containing protein n=1 Tax=Streptomyces sp. NPDC058256 TaxID=3346408 RepID=UPI0036EB04F4